MPHRGILFFMPTAQYQFPNLTRRKWLASHIRFKFPKNNLKPKQNIPLGAITSVLQCCSHALTPSFPRSLSYIYTLFILYLSYI